MNRPGVGSFSEQKWGGLRERRHKRVRGIDTGTADAVLDTRGRARGSRFRHAVRFQLHAFGPRPESREDRYVATAQLATVSLGHTAGGNEPLSLIVVKHEPYAPTVVPGFQVILTSMDCI